MQTNKRIRSAPLSAFASQVLRDHPGLSVAEARVVAREPEGKGRGPVPGPGELQKLSDFNSHGPGARGGQGQRASDGCGPVQGLRFRTGSFCYVFQIHNKQTRAELVPQNPTRGPPPRRVKVI